MRAAWIRKNTFAKFLSSHLFICTRAHACLRKGKKRRQKKKSFNASAHIEALDDDLEPNSKWILSEKYDRSGREAPAPLSIVLNARLDQLDGRDYIIDNWKRPAGFNHLACYFCDETWINFQNWRRRAQTAQLDNSKMRAARTIWNTQTCSGCFVVSQRCFSFIAVRHLHIWSLPIFKWFFYFSIPWLRCDWRNEQFRTRYSDMPEGLSVFVKDLPRMFLEKFRK